MGSSKMKRFYVVSNFIGAILILSGCILFFRSDTPDIYYYNVHALRYILAISGMLLIIIDRSVYSSYTLLKKEIEHFKQSTEHWRKKSQTFLNSKHQRGCV